MGVGGQGHARYTEHSEDLAFIDEIIYYAI